MQVHKKYKIHNNNPVNSSEKLTQTMCVNPDTVQPHWKSYLRKKVKTVDPIIG